MKDVPNFARIGQQKLLRGDNISTKSLNTGVGVHQMDDWRMRSSAKRGVRSNCSLIVVEIA